MQRIGETLLNKGLINENQLELALTWQLRTGGRLGAIIIQLGFAPEESVIGAIADQFDMPVVDLSAVQPAHSAIQSIPLEFARVHQCLPLSADDNEITIALADPLDIECTDRLAANLNKRVRIQLALPSQIESAIQRIYSVKPVTRRRKVRPQKDRQALLALISKPKKRILKNTEIVTIAEAA
jgi:hypothetical protein